VRHDHVERCRVALILPNVVRFDCEEDSGHPWNHEVNDEHGLSVTWPDTHPMSHVTDPALGETGMPAETEVKQ